MSLLSCPPPYQSFQIPRLKLLAGHQLFDGREFKDAPEQTIGPKITEEFMREQPAKTLSSTPQKFFSCGKISVERHEIPVAKRF
jgi:hypothetical protein